MPHDRWSPEQTERLAALWAQGLSAAAIAAALRLSRNAVLGKAWRMGLTRPARGRAHASPSPRPAPPRAPPRRARTWPRLGAWPPEAAGSAGGAAAARLEDLAPGSCRWPVGEPGRPGFGFCGERADRGPYCEAHHRQAHRSSGRDWRSEAEALLRLAHRWG